MRIRTGALAVSLVLIAGALADSAAAQDESFATAIEESYRLGLEAFANADVERIAAAEGHAVGFGFRTFAPRGVGDATAAFSRPLLQAFFNSMEYYRLRLDEIHTLVQGDVGVAWGFHTEEFQRRGMEPESYRVRFSFTVVREEDGTLRYLMSHRERRMAASRRSTYICTDPVALSD